MYGESLGLSLALGQRLAVLEAAALEQQIVQLLCLILCGNFIVSVGGGEEDKQFKWRMRAKGI